MGQISNLLRDELKSRQAKNPNFSMRSFARWLGVSPAQLSQLLSGKRPMTIKMATNISIKLGLSPVEYSELLNSYLLESNRVPESQPISSLSEDQFRLIADWYHFAILSLTKLPRAKSDSQWIARQLGISVAEAREAVSRLIRLGLLEIKPQFRQIGSPVMVESSIPSAAIQKFHKQLLSLVIEKIDLVPLEDRDLQAVTMQVNRKKLPKARKIIDEAITKVMGLLESGPPSDVYSLSVQLVPLTPTDSKGGIEK